MANPNKVFDMVKKEKYCCGCKQTKSFSFFHKDKSSWSGYSGRCKPCVSSRQRLYIKKRKDNGTNSLYYILYYKKNDVKRYGITIKIYNEMVISQNGVCLICKGPPGGRGSLHVDHCHESGKVRGLLCHYCNISLGSLKENKDTLKNMISYLEEHS